MANHDEAVIEAEIQRKGLNAPRLTPQQIDDQIVGKYFHVVPHTTMTLCVLTLKNGFSVTGESAAASAANFDPEIGQKIAFDNARGKIWALEGYVLRTKLAEQAAVGGTFLDRVKAEAKELEDRLVKLAKFMDLGDTFSELAVEEQSRLVRQRHAMGEYLAVLNERIAAAGKADR